MLKQNAHTDTYLVLEEYFTEKQTFNGKIFKVLSKLLLDRGSAEME